MEHTWDEIAAAVSLLREVMLNDADNVGLSEAEAEQFEWLTSAMQDELSARLGLADSPFQIGTMVPKFARAGAHHPNAGGAAWAV